MAWLLAAKRTLQTLAILAPPAAFSQSVTYESQLAAHSQGNIQLTVVVGGEMGAWSYKDGLHAPFIDPITGDEVFGFVYPRGFAHALGGGSQLSGGVIGNDTVIISPGEHSPAGPLYDRFMASSTDQSKTYYLPSAHSELDLVSVCADTSTDNPYYNGTLGTKIVQRSMAWSGSLIDDFVLFYCEVTNIGDGPITEYYVGVNWSTASSDEESDQVTGFFHDYLTDTVCPSYEGLNLAYMLDRDGDPQNGEFPSGSPISAVGTMYLGSNADPVNVNYNWWDRKGACWGPRHRGTVVDPYRQLDFYLGSPATDEDYYYLLSHSEIDYDQIFAAVDHQDQGWLGPPDDADLIANGSLCYYLLSFGPFEIGAHETIWYAFAVLGGEHVHCNPNAVFDPYDPQAFYEQLDFSALVENARWAKRVYDIPGYDSNGDGNRGEFYLCDGDTVWTKGDGVPDFKADSPPPAPVTRYITETSKITVRWNGYYSETTVDPFSELVDFEGYKVYAGLDDRRGSLSLLSSYDRLDFRRFRNQILPTGEGRWESDESPFGLDSLRSIYEDEHFDPLSYPLSHPLIYYDTAWYFEPVLYNQYDLSDPRGIHKVYPDATDPGADSTLWTDDDITLEHGQPLPKYYEYEYVYDNILPTVTYFMSVTALDYGFTGGHSTMPPQESNPLNNITEVYALPSTDEVVADNLDVIVYPNPYRADAHYEDDGFENRKGVIIPDRARLIHFANLPNVCKISIFSLDGDLIGTVRHNFPNGGPEAMHDWWDLSTRSGLTVTSGLYYWVVESDTRTQIGKLVILK